MKNKILEQSAQPQTPQAVNLQDAMDVYKCSFLQGSELRKKTDDGSIFATRLASNNEKLPSDVSPGDRLYIMNDYTFRIGKYTDVNGVRKPILQPGVYNWKCDAYKNKTPKVALTPEQKRAIEFYTNPQNGYTEIVPAAGDTTWGSIDLHTLLPDDFPYSKKLYKKIGLNTSDNPDLNKFKQTYILNKWMDYGGAENKNLASYMDEINLKNEENSPIKGDYFLYRNIEEVSANVLINELDKVIGTNDTSKGNCKTAIQNYDALSKKKVTLDPIKLKNYKLFINKCNTNNYNYLDLNKTHKKLAALAALDPKTNRYSLTAVANTASAPQVAAPTPINDKVMNAQQLNQSIPNKSTINDRIDTFNSLNEEQKSSVIRNVLLMTHSPKKYNED